MSELPHRQQEQIVVREVTAATLDSDIAKGSLLVPALLTVTLRTELASGVTGVLVGESPDGDPRGQAGVWWTTPENDDELHDPLGEGSAAYIFGVWTQPQYEGRGVARALMHGIEARARRAGVPKLYLDVVADNERGRDFWHKQGYAPLDSGSCMPIFKQYRDGTYSAFPVLTKVIPMGKRLPPTDPAAGPSRK